MRLPCPFCGLRDAAEFAAEGAAAAPWPPLAAPAEAWAAALRLNAQARAGAPELWRHALGCRSLLEVARDPATGAVTEARFAHPGMAAALAEAAAGPAPAGAAAPVRAGPVEAPSSAPRPTRGPAPARARASAAAGLAAPGVGGRLR